jgi:hypothetical protein
MTTESNFHEANVTNQPIEFRVQESLLKTGVGSMRLSLTRDKGEVTGQASMSPYAAGKMGILDELGRAGRVDHNLSKMHKVLRAKIRVTFTTHCSGTHYTVLVRFRVKDPIQVQKTKGRK